MANDVSAPLTTEFAGLRSEEMILNLGPQHPSTHGVLRLVLVLDGETVIQCTPIIGYLHRGMEKIFENRPYMAGPRYIDNADYLSPMLNETCYAGAVEQLMDIEPPRRAQYLRLIVGELERIASHLVAVGTYGLDLGASTPVLWCFRDREQILDMFEAVSGHRFTHNYMRVGGVLYDLPKGWIQTCEKFLDNFEKVSLPELHELLTGNEIFEARTQGVGYIDPQQALAYALTGPVARASGVNFDLRVNRPYGAYREIAVRTQIRQDGDCFGRYRVRMDEMAESVRLCRVALANLPGGSITTRSPIALRPPRGETYYAVESARGEESIYMISDGSEYPYRAKLRGPSFVNLQILPELLRGSKIGDVIAILGSIDIVLGDVDR
ncbi:MAG: NADH-ubiquinone oxidoreductase chain D [Ktedonobacterales bacterium]|jgi:NADH-quinone oxidoreductase subunit D|nr:MAG: NADH-ubiquinone oxidoreductase chain D [Ktedonobacterales bacterium]